MWPGSRLRSTPVAASHNRIGRSPWSSGRELAHRLLDDFRRIAAASGDCFSIATERDAGKTIDVIRENQGFTACLEIEDPHRAIDCWRRPVACRRDHRSKQTGLPRASESCDRVGRSQSSRE